MAQPIRSVPVGTNPHSEGTGPLREDAAVGNAASRLARSRRAIIEQLAPPSHRPQPFERAGWFPRLRAGAAIWWRAHPAHLGLELATPVLSDYARRSPWRFLALAAAAGALTALARPWRLLSVTGLLMAVAKSSQLSSVLLSALSAAESPRQGETV